MHDALITPEDPPNEYDDIYWFVDHWVIVRDDGTHVLNGTPEQLEDALRTLIRGELDKYSWCPFDC